MTPTRPPVTAGASATSTSPISSIPAHLKGKSTTVRCSSPLSSQPTVLAAPPSTPTAPAPAPSSPHPLPSHSDTSDWEMLLRALADEPQIMAQDSLPQPSQPSRSASTSAAHHLHWLASSPCGCDASAAPSTSSSPPSMATPSYGSALTRTASIATTSAEHDACMDCLALLPSAPCPSTDEHGQGHHRCHPTATAGAASPYEVILGAARPGLHRGDLTSKAPSGLTSLPGAIICCDEPCVDEACEEPAECNEPHPATISPCAQAHHIPTSPCALVLPLALASTACADVDCPEAICPEAACPTAECPVTAPTTTKACNECLDDPDARRPTSDPTSPSSSSATDCTFCVATVPSASSQGCCDESCADTSIDACDEACGAVTGLRSKEEAGSTTVGGENKSSTYGVFNSFQELLDCCCCSEVAMPSCCPPSMTEGQHQVGGTIDAGHAHHAHSVVGSSAFNAFAPPPPRSELMHPGLKAAMTAPCGSMPADVDMASSASATPMSRSRSSTSVSLSSTLQGAASEQARSWNSLGSVTPSSDSPSIYGRNQSPVRYPYAGPAELVASANSWGGAAGELRSCTQVEDAHLHALDGHCLAPALTLSSNSPHQRQQQQHPHPHHQEGHSCQWADCGHWCASLWELAQHVNAAHLQPQQQQLSQSQQSSLSSLGHQHHDDGFPSLQCQWQACQQQHYHALAPTTAATPAAGVLEHLVTSHFDCPPADQHSILAGLLGESSAPAPSLKRRAAPEELNTKPKSFKARRSSTNVEKPASRSPVQGGSTEHRCLWESCTCTFESEKDLTEHISTHHVGAGKSTYECRWQGCARAAEKRTFGQRQKVMRHIQTHTGNRPHECDVCGNRFSEATTLAQHMRTHTNEKPYVCDHPGCGKAFSVAGSLTIHRRTHSGDKPFSCRVCGKSFAESSNLTKHLRVHSGEKPFACPECGKHFSRPDQVTRHRKSHAREREAKGGGQRNVRRSRSGSVMVGPSELA